MRKVMKEVMKGAKIRALRRAMKRGVTWAGLSVLSLSQASFAANAHYTATYPRHHNAGTAGGSDADSG